MSMTMYEFLRRYQVLRWEHSGGAPSGAEITALVEEAGVEWAPEPTPKPNDDVLVESRAGTAGARVWSKRWGGPIWQGVGHEGAASWEDLIKYELPIKVYRAALLPSTEGDQS